MREITNEQLHKRNLVCQKATIEAVQKLLNYLQQSTGQINDYGVIAGGTIQQMYNALQDMTEANSEVHAVLQMLEYTNND